MLRLAAEVLAAEIAARAGDTESAVQRLSEAVKIQDGHWFTEPPPWYYPVRQSLGAVLLQGRRPAEAEAVYREDLRRNPENGWALFLDAVPALAVYVGTECTGTFGPYRYRLPIHEPLARAILEQGVERGFDLLYTQAARLDYAFYVPLHFTMPEPAVPVVPLHVNVYLPPQPTPRRCHTWGRTLGDILGSRPERVVLMASGGMSHYPGTDRYRSPDYEWDRRAIAAPRD